MVESKNEATFTDNCSFGKIESMKIYLLLYLRFVKKMLREKDEYIPIIAKRDIRITIFYTD